MKIHITGNSGSGKSTLSRQLASKLTIPCVSLDSVVWNPGWQKADREEVHTKLDELLKPESWIIEGVSTRVLKAADLVIFLDIPTYQCLVNILSRFWSNGFKTREELPQNCPEYKGAFLALSIALKFNRNTRPLLLSARRENQRFITVTSHSQLEAIYENILTMV